MRETLLSNAELDALIDEHKTIITNAYTPEEVRDKNMNVWVALIELKTRRKHHPLKSHEGGKDGPV
jgi:hypothetical protein